MRIIIIALMLVLNLILEATVLQYMRIFEIKPDFTIIIIVSYAVMRGSKYGAFIGLFSGLLVDMMFGHTFGINALSYMLTGYLIGQAHETVFKDSVIPAILFNIFAVVTHQHILYVLAYFTGNLSGASASYLYVLTRLMLPQCVYNAVIGGIAYKYLYRLDEMDIMNKRIY